MIRGWLMDLGEGGKWKIIQWARWAESNQGAML
jgi:hypothetical protein